MQIVNCRIPHTDRRKPCGFTCNEQCTLYKATIENSMELKMKAFKEFKWKEKFNVDFDADKIFCYGCKPKDKPMFAQFVNVQLKKVTTVVLNVRI